MNPFDIYVRYTGCYGAKFNALHDIFTAVLNNFYPTGSSILHMIRNILHPSQEFQHCDHCVCHSTLGGKRVTEPLVACAISPVTPAEPQIPELYVPYYCTNESLIAEAQVCDGIADCPDKADEANCSCVCSGPADSCFTSCILPYCICGDHYYMCDGGGCVHYDKLCDGHPDCVMEDDDRGHLF